VQGDPINLRDTHGREVDCDPDEGCDTDPRDDNPYDPSCGPGGGGGGGGGGGSKSASANPCAIGNLSQVQQGMLSGVNWADQSAAAQQEFVDVTAYADSLGVDLSGFTVSSITIAGQGTATQTEVNLVSAAGTNLAVGLSSNPNFSSYATDWVVGAPHSGYTGNYRSTDPFSSLQINTNNGTAQLDIDPFNPAASAATALLHGGFQVLPTFVGKLIGKPNDTNPFSTRNALAKKNVDVGAPCTGH
jgi:hypothetical protein